MAGLLDYQGAFGTGSPAEMAGQPSGMAGLLGGAYEALGLLAKRALGSSEMMRQTGVYNPEPMVEAAMLPMGTGAIAGVPMRAGEAVLGAGPIRAYHGSPHDFDRFDLSKIGTGEGAQAYGHGLYFAENEKVAKGYRDNLSSWPTIQKQVFNPDGTPNRPGQVAEWLAIGRPESELASTLKVLDPSASEKQIADWIASGKDVFKKAGESGRMYEVNINADPAHFLDWDKPLAAQSPQVRDAVARLAGEPTLSKSSVNWSGDLVKMGDKIAAEVPKGSASDDLWNHIRGQSAHRAVDNDYATAATKLREAGIPGIKYLDQGSRTAGEGSRNYVVFDDSLINILRKYGIAGLLGAPPALDMANRQQ